MNYGQMVLGGLITCFGLFTLVMRLLKKDAVFKKLEAMKARYGEGIGSLIHLFAYSILPILFGIIFIIAALS